jgi:hypothetical protein
MLEIARLGQTVPFSIRNRIESSATPAARLSGSDDPAFQYPQSDRIVCNFCSFVALFHHSSTFSIRNRIESSATPRDLARGDLPAGFQYPQSDRIVCNSNHPHPVHAQAALSVSAIGSNRLQP